MTHAHDMYADHGNAPPSSRERISEILEKFPDIELPERSINAMITGATMNYVNNGRRDSLDFKDYHNDEHPYETLERGFAILGLLKNAGIDITLGDYEVVGIAIMFHDAIQQLPDWLPEDDKNKSAEQLSAEMALRYMPAQTDLQDGNGFEDPLRVRVYSAIEVTEGLHTHDGDFIREKLFEPGRHYTAWVVAMADTGKALFDDVDDVFGGDVSKLGGEVSDAKSTDVKLARNAYMKIIKSEKTFMERIDKDIRTGIELYFPEKADAVRDIFHRRFHANYNKMYKVAGIIDEHLSEINDAIEAGLNESKDNVVRRTELIHQTMIRVLHTLMKK